MTEPQIPIYLADGMPRRTFMKTLGIASGSLMLSGLPSLQAQTGQSGTSPFQLKAPEPNPKYGGTLRYGILSAPAHFDVHQSGTVSNMAAQGPMYDNLIRRHPLDWPDDHSRPGAELGDCPGWQDLYVLSAPGRAIPRWG